MNTIAAAFAEFISAFNSLDMERFVACLASDVSLFPPSASSAQLVEGVAAVERHFRGVFQAESPGGPNIEPAEVCIRQMGEHAGLVTFVFRREAGSMGRRSIVFVREAAAWRIAHIHAANTFAREGSG